MAILTNKAKILLERSFVTVLQYGKNSVRDDLAEDYLKNATSAYLELEQYIASLEYIVDEVRDLVENDL